MPIYEYKCTGCGHAMEVMQKISEPVLTDCPACNTPNLRKLVSAAAFHLKGSGWYVTDFKDKPKTGDAVDGKKAEGSDGKKAETSETSGSKDTKAPDKTEKKAESTPAKTDSASTKLTRTSND